MRSFFIAENIRMVVRVGIAVFFILLGFYMLVGSQDARQKAKLIAKQSVFLATAHKDLENEIMALKKEILYFSSTSLAYEQVAREELLMGRPGELVYLLEI